MFISIFESPIASKWDICFFVLLTEKKLLCYHVNHEIQVSPSSLKCSLFFFDLIQAWSSFCFRRKEMIMCCCGDTIIYFKKKEKMKIFESGYFAFFNFLGPCFMLHPWLEVSLSQPWSMVFYVWILTFSNFLPVV